MDVLIIFHRLGVSAPSMEDCVPVDTFSTHTFIFFCQCNDLQAMLAILNVFMVIHYSNGARHFRLLKF
jgi:hypothetical protein